MVSGGDDMNEPVLYLGDCLSVLPSLPPGSVDLMLCDPPYGCTARNRWDAVIPFEPMWRALLPLVKPSAPMIFFGSGRFTAELILSRPKLYRYSLVWQKTTPTGFLNANRMPLRSHEDIVIFYQKPPVYHPQKTQGHERKVSSAQHKRGCKQSTDYGEYGLHSYDSTERFPTSVLTFATDKQKEALHPTQKPVALLEWLIRSYTNEGDTVLDLCMGSGSTGVAALRTGRHFIGIEKDPDYYHIAAQRLGSAEGGIA